jgi:hypothetical protein
MNRQSGYLEACATRFVRLGFPSPFPLHPSLPLGCPSSVFFFILHPSAFILDPSPFTHSPFTPSLPVAKGGLMFEASIGGQKFTYTPKK